MARPWCYLFTRRKATTAASTATEGDEHPAFWVRVLYDYHVSDESSLYLSRGDIVEVLTVLENGWWDGLLGNERGWFPSNFAMVISEEEAISALRSEQGYIVIDPALLDASGNSSELLQNELKQATNSQMALVDGRTWVLGVQPNGQIIYVNGLGHRRRDISNEDNLDPIIAPKPTPHSPQPLLPYASIPTYQQSSTKGRIPSPPRRVITATIGEEKRVIVDVTGYSDPQAIREHILEKLQIPGGLYSAFAIYHKGLVRDVVGSPLDDKQLLLDCLELGDDKGSLVLVIQDTSSLPRSNASPPPTQPAQPLQLQEAAESTTGSNARSEGRENSVLSIAPQVNSSNHFNQPPLSHELDKPTQTPPSLPPGEVAVKISRTTSSTEIIQHLVLRGCRNLTADLVLASCSKRPWAVGGFGDVYRGQLGSGTHVAIKCARAFGSLDDEERQQKHSTNLVREIDTWSKLQHPHVLDLLGLAEYNGQIAMVSPWVEGGSLRQYIRKLPGANRPRLCMQVADGLSYLHQCGIIHADLRGDNVLVSDSGEPLITDFGNAALLERTLQFTSTTTKNQLSPRWTAPEILDGGPRSFKSDIFALGMTILEVITGESPYSGKSEAAAMCAIVINKPPERSEAHIPNSSEHGDQLWSLLMKCWTLDPAKRPTAVAVRDKLKTIKPGGLVARQLR